MRELTIWDLKSRGSRLLPDVLGDARITGGGVHVHSVDEVFIFLQGSGVVPFDGRNYAVRSGNVVMVATGEDHHTRSSVDDPLVAA